MEKFPPGERPEVRVVGSASPEKKETIKEELASIFDERQIDQFTDEQIELLKSEEKEKTSEDKAAIFAANNVTNQLLKKYGLTAFDVPDRNVHFVSKKMFKDAGYSSGTAMISSPKRQAVVVNLESNHLKDKDEESQGVLVAQGLLHEFSHFKGHLAIEINKEDEGAFYRHGWGVYPTQRKRDQIGDTEWFLGIHEAVAAEIEKTYSKDVLMQDPFTREYGEWFYSEEALVLKKGLAEQYEIDPDEICWLSRDGKKFKRYPYDEQRVVLEYVVDSIFEDGGFTSREDVMDMFIGAQFTGNLLSIGKLVERSFGQGSFRVLGGMEAGSKGTSTSTPRIIDALVKRRRTLK